MSAHALVTVVRAEENGMTAKMPLQAKMHPADSFRELRKAGIYRDDQEDGNTKACMATPWDGNGVVGGVCALD